MTAARSVLPRPRPRPGGLARPQLTSLVDMMVILLVFLLKSFSVEGQLVTPAPDLQLPESSAETPAQAMASLEITTGGLLLDGRPVAALPGAAHGDSLLVTPLAGELAALAGRPLAIKCDRRVDFAVLKRVLFTCDQAGCRDLSLLVLREEG